MTTRQLLNRNSYVLVGGIVLLAAAYFVAQQGGLIAWIVWFVALGLLYAGFLALRPGRPTPMTDTELEHLVGSGTPVLVELYSNY